MPADSKEFLLVEKGLLKVEGLVDDSWDEKDPVQSGYLFAKLKRFNLDLVKATFSTVESSRELRETVTAFKQSAKGSTTIGSGTSLLGATSAAAPFPPVPPPPVVQQPPHQVNPPPDEPEAPT
eukprot:s8441_g1.t1